MDNRPMMVQLKPKGRRKILVTTDMVTGGLKGYKTDNFSLKNALKGIGDLAKDSGIPGVGLAGSIISKAADSSGKKKATTGGTVLPGVLGDYEGRLLRDKSDSGKVFLISNGQPVYQSTLTKDQWSKVTDVARLPPSGTVQKVTSVTPMISPLPMSVPVTPSDANIFAAIQESQRNNTKTLADQIQEYVQMIPKDQQQAIKTKAQNIFNSGSNGVLTAAQKKLQSLSTSILPKTKGVKDAEALLTAPQHGEKSDKSTLSFSSPWVIGGIVAVVVVIVVAVILKR